MIYDDIQFEIKAAMLAHDNIKRDCLRSIVSEVKNQTVNAGKPLTEDIVVKVLQKSVKMHNDSIQQFESAGRADLAEKEKLELEHISRWLPKMLSEDQTIEVLKKLIADNNIAHGKQNFGMVMKLIKDRQDIDKKTASKLLQQML